MRRLSTIRATVARVGLSVSGERGRRAPLDDRLRRWLRQAGLSDVDVVEFEKNKIRGAIRTDLILSAEIIAITLGTVAGAPSFMMPQFPPDPVDLVIEVGLGDNPLVHQ